MQAVRYFSSVHTRVAIVGGGVAGNSVSSQLVNKGAFKAEEITVFDKSTVHYYQPGFTNVAGGVWSDKETASRLYRDREGLLKRGVNWVRDNVETFAPEENSVTTAEGQKVTYDYLVVCPGYELRYDMIPGSSEALDDPNCPVGSMYRFDYAEKMRRLREGFKGGKAIFTVPQMPIKCGGAPQKIMHLSEETWRRNGVRDNCDVHFYTSGPSMFPVKKYSDALLSLTQNKNIGIHFSHLIKSVDASNKTVTFQAGEEQVTTEFDLLHVVPPQTTPKAIRESPIAAASGMIDVDAATL